jgi:hypothetical protein
VISVLVDVFVMFVMFVMLMPAGAAFVMLVVIMTAGAAFVVFMVIMTAGAAFVVFMVVMSAGTTLVMMFAVIVTGMDGHFAFHSAGDGGQLLDQSIGILCGQPQLAGGKGDGGAFHFGQGIEFVFDFGGAVGAVQILDDICLLSHRHSP